MNNAIHTLSAQYDLWVSRYKTFFATNEEDIEGCVNVLESVRRKELNRVAGDSVLQSHAFSGNQLSYRLAACYDKRKKRIIGCIRLTRAAEAANVDASRKEYHLHIFDDEQLDQLTIFTRLAVLKEYRRSPAALALMAFCFLEVLKEGGQAILMSCEPNLYPMYQRLGLRPIGPMHNSPSGGYRIPMICIPDEKHFRSIRNPGLPLLKSLDFSKYGAIRDWYKDYIAEHPNLNVGADVYQGTSDESQLHKAITTGLSKQGLKLFLKNAVELKCKEGDVLIAEKDGGKTFGFVKSGQVKVIFDKETSILLEAGELFGEIAFVLDINRSAKVIASDANTTVVMFSASALNRLENESDRSIIWRNFARVLAEKILTTNGLLN